MDEEPEPEIEIKEEKKEAKPKKELPKKEQCPHCFNYYSKSYIAKHIENCDYMTLHSKDIASKVENKYKSEIKEQIKKFEQDIGDLKAQIQANPANVSEIKMIIKFLRDQVNSKYSGGKKNLFWNKENKEKLEKWLSER